MRKYSAFLKKFIFGILIFSSLGNTGLIYASGYASQSYEKVDTDGTYFDNDHLSSIQWFAEGDLTGNSNDYFAKVGATYYDLSSLTYCTILGETYTPLDEEAPFPDSDFTNISCTTSGTSGNAVKTSADNDSLYINHPAESCSDGIQNGDETGIDTGGDECEVEEETLTTALNIFDDLGLSSIDTGDGLLFGSVGSMIYISIGVLILGVITFGLYAGISYFNKNL